MRIKAFQRIIDSIRGKKRKLASKPFIPNVFNSNFNKKVLVSYILVPFLVNRDKWANHTNNYECYTACEIFHKLGYQVDVVYFDYLLPAEKISEYEVVYGFGRCFNAALPNPKIKTIYYTTMCHSDYMNYATIKRGLEVYKEKGFYEPNSIRTTVMFDKSALQFVDLIIALGNGFSAETYKKSETQNNVKSLDLFPLSPNPVDASQKDFEKIKRNFVWFASLGAIHKGLDLVIDVFLKRKDINLTICGFNSSETEFFNYYKDVLENKIGNIRNAGFVHPMSEEFKRLMMNNTGCIMPSLCESGGGGVKCLCDGGLLPIVSKQTGIDVEQYGFQLEEHTTAEIERKIDKVLDTPTDKLKDLSIRVQNDSIARYSYDNYRKQLTKYIEDVIRDK